LHPDHRFKARIVAKKDLPILAENKGTLIDFPFEAAGQ
jgi:hypothetical protein